MTVVNTSRPVVSGVNKVGSTLETSDGVWTKTLDYITYEYQWMRCNPAGGSCVDIAGATNKQYVVTAADKGFRLRSRVTAKDHVNPTDPGGGTPPTGTKLRWAPPTLSGPITRTLSDSGRSIPIGSGSDLKIVAPTRLTGSVGQVEGYNDVVAIGGEIVGGSYNSSGSLIPRMNSGVFHVEGWRFEFNVPADAITARWITPTLQIQNCFMDVTHAGTSFHSDGFQSQEAILDSLRFDRCTIKTDYQGIFMSNEAQNQGPARSKITHQILSRILFLAGQRGLPATFFFKAFPPRPNADPIGLTEMYDVWQPITDALAHTYPNGHTWVAWDGTPNRYGCFLTTKLHANGTTYPFLRFSTSADVVPAGKPLAGQQCGDCNVRGDGGIWLYTSLSQVPTYVGCDSNVGKDYVSPGYL